MGTLEHIVICMTYYIGVYLFARYASIECIIYLNNN